MKEIFQMMRVTRDFIKARQVHCHYLVEMKKVKPIGGGDSNKCYENAHAHKDRAKKIRMVFGWIVCPHDTKTNSTEIIQHCWNATDDGNHFDATFPPNASIGEYVIDMDLFDYCHKNDSILRSHLASSLLYSDGIYQAADEGTDGQMIFRSISSLSTAELYKSKLIEPHKLLAS